MLTDLLVKIQDKLNNILKKLKEKDKETFDKFVTKNTFKILKRKDKIIKSVLLFDEFLLTCYGPDNEIYLDWKDCLNVISIDPDRK